MKLFSFEDDVTQDVEATGTTDSVEAAVNEAVVEAEQEHPDEEIAAVDEAIEAGGDLEQVEEFVEKQEEQGGMDEDTAEAVKIAVEAIAHRVGYNPKNIYQLYATESFASSSSRRINTQLAMEGIRDFLKNLWEKIKAFVMKIWGKLKEFWDKHFSTVGRLVKKLEALSERIADSSGNRKDTGGKDIKAPSDIARAFRTTSTLSIADVREYVTEASGFITGVKEKVTNGINTYLSDVTTIMNNIKGKYSFGSEIGKVTKEQAQNVVREVEESYTSGENSKELNTNVINNVLKDVNVRTSDSGKEITVISKVVGGKKLVVEFDEYRINLNLTSGDDSYDSSVDIVVPSKKDLSDLNRDMTKMLNIYLYLKDNVNKVNDAVNKFIKNADKQISNIAAETGKYKNDKNQDDVNNFVKNAMEKSLGKIIHMFSRVSTFYANVFKMAKTITISTIQAGVRYIIFILKQYKPVE